MNINPRTWDESQTTQRKRGRKPGQLLGAKYNVPKRIAITIYLAQEVVQNLTDLTEVALINRSQAVTTAIQKWVMRGKPKTLMSIDKANSPHDRHHYKSNKESRPKKSVSINLPDIAFKQIADASSEWNQSRSEVLGAIIEDAIVRGVIEDTFILPSEELA